MKDCCYIREILNGFFSLLVGMKVTIVAMFSRPSTVQWPRETAPLSPRYRGHIILTMNESTGFANCIACGSCARNCPSGCIEVAGKKPEGGKKKSVSSFYLDFTKCSLCGICVESCPVNGLDFSKNYSLAGYDSQTFASIDLMYNIPTPFQQEVSHV